MTKLRTKLLAAAIAIASASNGAQAALLTIDFTASVNTPGFGHAVGDVVDGSFTYNTATPGMITGDGMLYADAVTNFTFDGRALTVAPHGEAQVLIDTYAANGIADSFRVTETSTVGTLDFTLSTDSTTGALPAD